MKWAGYGLMGFSAVLVIYLVLLEFGIISSPATGNQTQGVLIGVLVVNGFATWRQLGIVESDIKELKSDIKELLRRSPKERRVNKA